MKTNFKIFIFCILVPIFLYLLYIFLKLDTVGGFFENNEVTIKILLSIIICIGSVLLFLKSIKNKAVAWSVFSGIIFLLSIISILFVYTFRHGVGF